MPIIPLLLALCATTWAGEESYETAIAVKQGIQDFADSIAMGADSYNEFVRNSKIFVDNSLFIKEVLTSDQQTYIICPRKYGKSLNADMLKTFLEMRVDDKGNRILPVESSDAYKLFVHGEIVSNTGGAAQKLEKPLLISKHKDLVQKYLGNHPVVYLDFKNIKGNTSEDVDGVMGETIKRTFLQHKYMIDILRQKKLRGEDADEPTTTNLPILNCTDTPDISNLTRFEQILQDNHGRKFLEYDSIRYLTKVLYEHFNKTVFVIFDNYDKPFYMTLHMQYFPVRYYDEIIRYMDYMAAETFKQNKYLLNGVVMSTFRLHQYGRYHLWDSYTFVDLLMHSHPFIHYFGFSQTDVQLLFDKHNLPADLRKQAPTWYNGYKSGNFTRDTYNPHTIASFLKHKKLANYFYDDEDRTVGQNLSRHSLTRNRLVKLINGHSLFIQRKPMLNQHFVLHLKIGTSIYAYRDFVWYLYRTGYLQCTDQFMHFKIPNKGVAEEIANWVISYYQREYNIVENRLQDSAAKLLEFVTDKAPTPSSLETSLANLYADCVYPNVTGNATTYHLSKDPLRFIFATVVLKMRSLSMHEIDVYCNRTMKADAVIANNQTGQGFIVELDHTGQSVEHMLQLAKIHEPNVTIFLNHLTKVKLVAVKISPNRTVRIVSKSKDEVILQT